MTGTPTAKWGFPTYDGTEPGSLKTVANAQANAAETAMNNASTGFYLRYATKALLTANSTASVGQHATVYADSTPANNGDYVWSGSAWLYGGVASGAVTYASGISAQSGYTTQLDKSIDGIATLNFGVSNSSTTPAGLKLMDLPAGFRPSNPSVLFTGTYNALTVVIFYTISSVGALVAYPTTTIGAGANLYGSISFRTT